MLAVAAAADMPREGRGTIIEALPIAVALAALDADGRVAVVDSNMRFRDLEARSPNGPFLAGRDLAMRVDAFLRTEVASLEMDWTDGDTLRGRHFTVRLARLPRHGADARRCLVSLLERTAEIETQRTLSAELLHDSLTGLPNRAAFEETVEQALAAGAAGPRGDALADAAPAMQLAVLVVDLTRFSRINECMGSVVGDELIITFARRLLGAVRNGDWLARIGGDEFGVLMHVRNGEADLIEAAARIHRALAVPFRLSELEIRVDCAIGGALAGGGTIPEDLIRNAQLALKRAKESGGVEIYQRGEVAAALRRFSIETELRRAIERGSLTLAWQPVIDLQRGGIAGFEALARWTHPDRGMISPVEFIPVAEESGLIVPLGRWALDSALRTLAAWDVAAGGRMPVSVAVNVSPLQLARDDVAARVGEALAKHGIDGRRLTVELTESAIVRDPARAMRVLGQLAEQETTVAMDDFGTGYSNLAYLQKLPIDLLKIDRSFVTPMLTDRDSAAIVRAILSLAESLGMRTTAEGVETGPLAQALAALGSSYAQGYHFAKPLEPDAAFAYWRANAA